MENRQKQFESSSAQEGRQRGCPKKKKEKKNGLDPVRLSFVLKEKRERKKNKNKSKTKTKMFGCVAHLTSGGPGQLFLSVSIRPSQGQQVKSWFDHSWLTTWKYGYSNVELPICGTQGADGVIEYKINTLPFDILGKLCLEQCFPAIDHPLNRKGKGGKGLKGKYVKKRRGSSSDTSSSSWSSSSSSSTSSSSTSEDSNTDDYANVHQSLPAHHAYWNQEVAYLYLKHVGFSVGGFEFTGHAGEMCSVVDCVSKTLDHNTDEECGRYRSDVDLCNASLRTQYRYVEPLVSIGESLSRFWPIFLSREIETVLRVQTQPLEMLYISSDKCRPWLVHANRELCEADIKMKCFADVYLLTRDEIADRLAKPCKQFLLIQNQVHEQEVPATTTDTPVPIKLNYRHPCTQFFFTVQEKRNREMKDYHNWWFRHGDSIREASLTIDGHDQVPYRKAPWWRQFTARRYSRKPGCPVYVFSPSFYPERLDIPSGDVDMDDVKDYTLWLKLPIGMDVAIVKVYTRSYNMISFRRDDKTGLHNIALAFQAKKVTS